MQTWTKDRRSVLIWAEEERWDSRVALDEAEAQEPSSSSSGRRAAEGGGVFEGRRGGDKKGGALLAEGGTVIGEGRTLDCLRSCTRPIAQERDEDGGVRRDLRECIILLIIANYFVALLVIVAKLL